MEIRCAELVALLKCTTDSIYFTRYIDGKGVFEIVSEAKARHYGLNFWDMVGKNDFDFLPEEEALKAAKDDHWVMENDKPIEDRIEELPHGIKSVSKYPWKNEQGEIIGVIGVSRDITKRVRIERQILDMLSIATHDMRDPLSSIGATVKLMIRGIYGTIDESVKKTLLDVHQRILGLENILRNYLSKSSLLNADIPEKEKFDLRQDIIDPILDELSPEIAAKGVLIDNRLGSIPGNRIMVNAHGNWLRIIYRNLINNAIKHGKGRIAFGVEEKDDHYRLNIFNNGPGVPLGEREKIFEKLHSKGSTGIGLFIVRNLIRKHGGDIWYEEAGESNPNFVFTLPKYKEEKMEKIVVEQKKEIHLAIWAYMLQMKGKKKLKEKDILKKISEDTGLEKNEIKGNLRGMIDKGVLMYSYGGGASSVEIPSEEYLKEKGLTEVLTPDDTDYTV